MKVLLEKGDFEDYLEIQLTRKEIAGLLEYEMQSKDMPDLLRDKKNLNITIVRMENAAN